MIVVQIYLSHINDSDSKQYIFNHCNFNGITSRGVTDTIDDIVCKDKSQISDFANEVLQLTCTKNNQIRGVISIIEASEKAIVFYQKEIKRNINNRVTTYVIEELVEIITD